MRKIEITADRLVSSLLALAKNKNIAILDSCGVGSGGSNFLIAGVDAVEVCEITNDDAAETLAIFHQKLGRKDRAAIFTISYDFGLKLQNIKRELEPSSEPDIYIASYDCLIIHNYDDGRTFLSGNPDVFDPIESALFDSGPHELHIAFSPPPRATVRSNFTQTAYLTAIQNIKERIRSGDTYQTNLTQQLTAELSGDLTGVEVFRRLRRDHPASFAAYIDRESSSVVSASPELFLRVSKDHNGNSKITSSPIKGTRRRGK
ncbi:MAG: chorismate-binding protein, partial [Pyrinomonadaceae bacterium]